MCLSMAEQVLLEEFACMPEFVLVSTIVLVRSIWPNQCLGVTLFSYFRCFYLSLAKIIRVKTGEIASTQDLLLDPLQPQHAVCPAKIWSVLRTYHNYINPNTLLWHNSHKTIVPKPLYGL